MYVKKTRQMKEVRFSLLLHYHDLTGFKKNQTVLKFVKSTTVLLPLSLSFASFAAPKGPDAQVSSPLRAHGHLRYTGSLINI